MSIVNFVAEHLGPYYAQVKFIHLLFATMWLWSTSVAYINYVVPVLRQWFLDPNSPELLRKRNEALERFDEGVVIEHVAFPFVLVTGVLLLMIGGWGVHNDWLVIKLALVILVFIPIEIFDYWLSHFGGNKRKARLKEGVDALDSPRYEKLTQMHIWFLTVTTPVISMAGITVLYLATAKPA
ncbi:hypothetical protein IB286_03580 [Spongiibacter sp. KMU-158]|uniref:DUF2269 family protein n=1 Tax=Spongiibacter pelagi TaxID=2760804 RepID=A0A927GUX9_9GAMM|nr:hypothetical protein [Spongiibacter pelagi]MBD2858076.1 hypothetical protein [Spongiibacter pelagi]